LPRPQAPDQSEGTPGQLRFLTHLVLSSLPQGFKAAHQTLTASVFEKALSVINTLFEDTIPSLVPYLQKQPDATGFIPGTAPNTSIQHGFQNALDDIRTHSHAPEGKFVDLMDQFPMV
jgi:hypothetical protein